MMVRKRRGWRVAFEVCIHQPATFSSEYVFRLEHVVCHDSLDGLLKYYERRVA
jgi:hypothetical protein